MDTKKAYLIGKIHWQKYFVGVYIYIYWLSDSDSVEPLV